MGGDHTCHGCMALAGTTHKLGCTRAPAGARVTDSDCAPLWPNSCPATREAVAEQGECPLCDLPARLHRPEAPSTPAVEFKGRSILVYGEVYSRSVHADDRRGLADAMTRSIRDVVEEQEAPCDVVALIVPAGQGQALFERLQEGV